jgi:hypothetical protein
LVAGPIDSPEVEFLDGGVGISLSTYPEGCPAQGVERDPVSGTWWCLHDAGVVVHVTDDALADRLVDTLRVRHVDPEDR